jgi:hypothetical protein
LELWDVKRRDVRVVAAPAPADEVWLSPDGSLIATGSGDQLYVVQASDGQVVEDIDFSPRHDGPRAVDLSGLGTGRGSIVVATRRGARFVFTRAARAPAPLVHLSPG